MRNLNQHAGGPLKANAADRQTMRAMIAVSGVLSRIVANTENRPARGAQLQADAKRWQPELSRLLDDAEGAALVLELAALAAATAVNIGAIETCLGQIAARLCPRRDAASQRLLLEIVEREYRAAADVETKVAELTSGTASHSGDATQAGLDEEQQSRLAALLRVQCGESERLGIVSVKVNPGGLSKRTIFVELRNNSVLPTQIVLRQDLASSPLGTTVTDEYPLLKVLFDAGVKVPKPFAIDATGSIAGSPLIVVDRASGIAIGDGMNIFDNDNHASAALVVAREMAKYHAIPVERLPDSVLGKHKTNVEIMRADVELLKQKWDACSATSAVIDAALGWLFDHLDAAGEQRSLTHGDMRFHNVLIDGDDVSVLLDWELAMVASPGFDLAYIYQDAKKLVDWQAFLTAYTAAGGVVPSREIIDFYLIRTEVFIAINMSLMEDGFAAGAFDDLLTVYGSIAIPPVCRHRLAERLLATLAGAPL